MQAIKPKVVVVMPAYNAANTLQMTYTELPHDAVDLVILVDDGSSDQTVRIARELGLALFVHNRNYGYGANQKTCYREALKAGAETVVMVHPDYQYDPKLLPDVIRPIQEDRADVVLGAAPRRKPHAARDALVEIRCQPLFDLARKHRLWIELVGISHGLPGFPARSARECEFGN